MVESGVDACASDTRASGGDCVGRFSKVLKWDMRSKEKEQIVQDVVHGA